LEELFIQHLNTIRYAGGFFALILLLGLAEKLRKQSVLKRLETKYFIFAAVMTGFMYLCMVTDKMTEPYLSMLWGLGAFGFLLYGFDRREKAYRWVGLGGFVFVLGRLFLHDFAQLEMFYRILSFIGLGAVLIVASLIYSHYAKQLQESV